MDGMLLLTLVAALAQPADRPSAPDSHDLRRERGDVMMIDGRPPAGTPSPCDDSLPAQPITDPAAYALPAPGAGRRWMRRGGDAVLVATPSGRVIEVVAGRFR